MSPKGAAKPRRILMCISSLSSLVELTIQQGIRRFSLQHQNWEIGFLDVKEDSSDQLHDVFDWKPDGVLVVNRLMHLPEVLQQRRIPTVVVDRHHDCPPVFSRVEIDNHAIGGKAAAYFLKQRFEHFAVVTSSRNPPHSSYRVNGYSEFLARHGLQPEVFQVRDISGKPWLVNPELNQWLEALPKPVGIYCVHDKIAQRIQERCRFQKLHIPTEVNVLGTDNHPLFCETSRPFLSSIPVPLEAAGFRAAEVLRELMNQRDAGKSVATIHERVEPGEVVERESTSLRAIPDAAIAKAAAYLRDHALRNGTIAEAATVAGINRRSLERKFRQHLGMTPGDFMQQVKTDHAKRLLTETELRISEIAEACGMVQDHFSTFFRNSIGIPPSTYRRNYKRPSKGQFG